MNILLMKMRSH